MMLLSVLATMAALSTNHARLMRQWVDDGANAARFGVSNHLNRQMFLVPIARLAREGQRPGQGEQTPLVSRHPPSSGVRIPPAFVHIPPGEVRTVSVAVLPHDGAWRIEFYYVLRDSDESYRTVLKRTVAWLRDRPISEEKGFLYTEWVKP